MKLPEHISMRIEHNPHRVDYQPIEQWVSKWIFLDEIAKGDLEDASVVEFFGPDKAMRHGANLSADQILAKAPADTIDRADLAEILRTGEVWLVIWYPHTPVGHCEVIAATLERALALANE